MHLQVLGSGSGGNAALVRAGECHLLLDAGLPIEVLLQRLDDARVAHERIGHVALTHGHLDHARAAGIFGRKTRATVHCCERLMSNASLRRAPRLSTLAPGGTVELSDPWGPRGRDVIVLRSVAIPHDADPTIAFRMEHAGRVAVLVTDMGHPDRHAARQLAGAHLLVLEFNHDLGMLEGGPYERSLKRRIAGPHGHLSNEQAAEMLCHLAGPELHTLVLAHLSEVNNAPLLALAAAREMLEHLGLGHVRVVIAAQHQIGENAPV
jgi:phosphoribosyl 1,2-cyclic phosphodiesterase